MSGVPQKPPVCLTIAGLDPSGGAGIVADIKTMSAFGCFAAAAVTSVTFQNTTGVFGAVHQSADSVRRQVDAVLDDYDIAVIKTGMLPTAEIIGAVADIVSSRHRGPLVVDPVVRSTSGFDLIDDAALKVLTEKLMPLATVVTPNLAEAERIVGFSIKADETLARAGEKMLSMGAKNVLIKGGHQTVDARSRRQAVDTLVTHGGIHVFTTDFIDTRATHGTGCTLASAIAANMALGKELSEAVRISKEFVTEAIRTAPGLGHGHSPINITLQV